MQNKGKWLENRGGHLLGRPFRAFTPGQLFGHGYASGRGSLIRGWYVKPEYGMGRNATDRGAGVKFVSLTGGY